MAVFTKGEFAIENPIRRANSSLSPCNIDGNQFCAPSPSRTTWSARSSNTMINFCLKSGSRLSPGLLTGGCGDPLPVAKKRTVSLVEVSPSTVMALNEFLFPPKANPATPRQEVSRP